MKAMIKNMNKIIGMNISIRKVAVCIAAFTLMLLSACSDDPTSENYYTFKGEMISEYLQKNAQFSEFSEIVTRAGLMDQLSAYGAYTCFAPTNKAIDAYLKERGLSSIDSLTTADCDTIARTHLVANMYSTSEMGDGVLTTPNMNRRYIEIAHGLDKDSNAVVILNKTSNVIFSLADDSVENGIMQPVDQVLVSSNRMLPDLMKQNQNIKLFYSALAATGLKDSMYLYKDDAYDKSKYERIKYVSHVNKETATVPDEHLYGFTAFCEPDTVFHAHNIYNLDQLATYAKSIYDQIYPDDADKYDDNYKDPRNPLNRFIAYHILNRIGLWNYLTVRDNITIETTLMNPTDWYETMLPHAIMKVEKLTVNKYIGMGTKGQLYLNRRYDATNTIEGAMVQRSVENNYVQQAANGIYYYVNDIVAYDKKTRDVVDNCRMRMDVSTFFPELMTNSIRMNGDYTQQDPDYDETAKYGRNYYFPDGYLKNVKVSGYFIYRRPHDYYSCYEGDEMNMFGDYDITFRLPPVPVEGEYQIRFGFAQESTRGVGQVYFDGKPQGIPIDMTIGMSSATIGGDYSKKWSEFTTDEKTEERKALKNKGYYRGPASAYRDRTAHYLFVNNAEEVRLVICTVHITPNEYHTLRMRNVSTNGSSEFMLDYFEIVPKSVYGITDEGQTEDDL
jgi:uncharacterized surface protein with fasciclin (FAS1) repeats